MRNLQRMDDEKQMQHTRVYLPSFYPAYLRILQPSHVGQFFNSQVPGGTKISHHFPHSRNYFSLVRVHVRRLKEHAAPTMADLPHFQLF